MSYWISLQNEKGDVPVVDSFEEGGTFQMGGSVEADLNVTYNYAGKFKFRGLHGRIASETIPEFETAIVVLKDDESDDYWEPPDGNVKRTLKVLLTWAKQFPQYKWNVN